MLHWCGNSSSGGPAAPCSFSILFPVSGKHGMEEDVDGGSASSSVDCTLTLGTPYTRQLSSSSSSSSSRMQRSTTASTMCWDILPQQGKQSLPPNVTGGTHAGGGGSCGGNVNGDPLISRRCANCDTTSTPLWRNGPRGPKSLCNACGIRYKKEERRAAASSTAATATGEGIGYSYPYGNTQPAWGCYVPAETVVKSSVSGYAGGEVEEQRELYLPWRLNVVPTQYR